MGDKSAIEWTDATWNPVTGCTKVSQGCKHCYAERVFPRVYGNKVFRAQDGDTYLRTFTDVQCHPDRLDQPLHWKKPRRIFVNSMSDLFHESVPFAFAAQVFGYMHSANWHTFQVLTKRPQRMLEFIRYYREEYLGRPFAYAYPSEYPHVHLGVSAEDQETADERIPLLLQTPAAVRFISAEPLLGPIDLTRLPVPRKFIDYSFGERGGEFVFNALTDRDDDHFFNVHKKIDWVICGGESGPKARPMHPDWARSLRDQCVGAGVPFFFKQWGEWAPKIDRDHQDPDWRLDYSVANKEPRNYRILSLSGGQGFHGERVHLVKRVGKKKAGATLDGKEWREFPTLNS